MKVLLHSCFKFHLFSNRKGEGTGYFPSMFLQKASKKAQSQAAGNNLQGQKPPPRRCDAINKLKYSDIQG